MNPTRKSFTPADAAAMTSYITTYIPKSTRWVEPEETVTVSVITHRASPEGHHAVYRRDTDFSGNLAEAIKLFQWNADPMWC